MQNVRAMVIASVAAFLLPLQLQAQNTKPAPKAKTVQWSTINKMGALFPSMLIANSVRTPPGNVPATLKGDPYGLLGVHIRTVEPDSNLVVTIKVPEFAETTAFKFKLATPGEYDVFPRIHWDYEKLRKATQPVPAIVTFSVTLNDQSLGQRSSPMRVQSVNDVPLSVKMDSGERLDTSWMFVAFVNEEHPWIDKLLAESIKSGHVKSFVGYQRGPEQASKQVEAIYDTLKKRGIVYSSITTTSSPNTQVSTQHVRFLSDSVGNSQANCIDGVVLMASILRKIGIQPIIILGPGHAMLGYREDPKKPREIIVVETTMIGSAPFDKAVKAGDIKFKQWSTAKPVSPYFREIDVAKFRAAGVMPISR